MRQECAIASYLCILPDVPMAQGIVRNNSQLKGIGLPTPTVGKEIIAKFSMLADDTHLVYSSEASLVKG